MFNRTATQEVGTMTDQNQTPDITVDEDTKGHVRARDDDDVEGHGARRGDDDDVEGHGARRGDDDDVEGHFRRSDDSDDTDDDDDVEGHGARR
jgi:hypothetical protein